MKRPINKKVNYLVYPKNYIPLKSEYYEAKNIGEALSKARALGVGAIVDKHIDLTHSDGSRSIFTSYRFILDETLKLRRLRYQEVFNDKGKKTNKGR